MQGRGIAEIRQDDVGFDDGWFRAAGKNRTADNRSKEVWHRRLLTTGCLRDSFVFIFIFNDGKVSIKGRFENANALLEGRMRFEQANEWLADAVAEKHM